MSNPPWRPAPGRHPVSIGSSLTRSLKTRKGLAPPKRVVDRDFYSLRYRFKPSSVDTTQPGSMQVKHSKDVSSVTVEQPSIQAGESFVFTGTETPAKEWACVLIYDEQSNSYTLEKLDSLIGLEQHERKVSSRPSTSGKRPPPTSTNVKDTLDGDFADILPKSLLAREEEEESSPSPPSPQPAPPPPPKARPSQAKKPTKRPDIPEQIPEPKSEPVKRPAKRPFPSESIPDVDEEDLQFGIPAKKAKPSTSPSQREVEIPTQSTYAFPTANSVSQLPSTSLPALPLPPPAPAPEPAVESSDSEEESDWEEIGISAPSDVPLQPIEQDMDEEGEEIDGDAFETLMNEQLEDDGEEDLASAIAEPEPERSRGAPMSLLQYAGGEDDDDDDDSSSESSDDD